MVRAEETGDRLDILLATRVGGLSRRRAWVLIVAGSVFVGNRRITVHSRRVMAGQEIVCHDNPFPTAENDALEKSLVLYEDRNLIAASRPTRARQ